MTKMTTALAIRHFSQKNKRDKARLCLSFNILLQTRHALTD